MSASVFIHISMATPLSFPVNILSLEITGLARQTSQGLGWGVRSTESGSEVMLRVAMGVRSRWCGGAAGGCAPGAPHLSTEGPHVGLRQEEGTG